MEHSLIQTIDKLMSTIAMFSLIIVIVKFVTKILKKNGLTFLKTADTWLMKIHKPAAIVLIISGAIHGILSVSNFSRFGVLPYIVGTICVLSCIASATCFYLRKKFSNVKSWLLYHRVFSVISLITFFGHIMLLKAKF